MAVIRNKLNQRLLINLKGGETLGLLAKGTADIAEDELSSPQLKTLISKGEIIVSRKEEKPKRIEPAESYVKKGKK